jgi:transposase
MDRTNPGANLYVGVDVHERESQVAVLEPNGTLLQEKRMETKDLSKFIDSLEGSKCVAIESIGFIYPVYDKLSALPNCHVAVANPYKLGLITKSNTKNDKADAKILGELLRTNFLPLSWIPEDEETREKRFLVKDRVRYGIRRSGIKGSIRWLLKRRGIDIKSPFSPEGIAKLRELGLLEIDTRIEELVLVESTIERLDVLIEKIASKDGYARLLDTIPGVAAYTALFLSSLIGDIDRFPDSKHLCAYFGLVPSLHQSGDTYTTGHITKAGNKWVRRNLTECTRVAVRKDPHLQMFYLGLRRKRGEKKAIIATARKIISYAFWMLKRNLTYEELAPWTIT